MIVLVNHLIHKTEPEVTTWRHLFGHFCQTMQHVHLIHSRSHPDIQDVIGIPVRMILPVNKESHRFYGIVVAETTKTDVLTESHYRIITGSSGFVHLHPRIFFPSCLVEDIHIPVASLEVTPFGNLNSKHR